LIKEQDIEACLELAERTSQGVVAKMLAEAVRQLQGELRDAHYKLESLGAKP